jgi:hypothetical protein
MTSLGTTNPHICTNLVPGYTTTVSSTTPIVLTAASNNLQHFTGTVAQSVQLPPSNTLQNGFTYIVNNQSTATATVYAAGPINGTTVANYTFPLTTITVTNVNGVFPGGGGTFNILTTTGLQLITYTSYAAGVFTFASAGTGTALTGAVVSTSISSVTVISSGIERKFVVTDSAGGNLNGNINGWFPTSANDMVMDVNATPKYPLAPQTDGVWYGTSTKANVSSTGTAIGNSAVANGFFTTALGGLASSTGNASVAIGYQASGTNASTTVGYQASATGGIATAVGYQSLANGGDATALGFFCQATGTRCLAVGAGCLSSGAPGSVAIGNGAQATSGLTVAIGHTPIANASGAIAIGYDSRGNVANCVCLGVNSISAGAQYALSFGLNAASVNPNTLGMTLNAGARQIPAYGFVYNSTATANTVTTLTVGSAKEQYFSGTQNQGVVLPVSTTLNNAGNPSGGGFCFDFVNRSTGTVSVGSQVLTTVLTTVALPAATIYVASNVTSLFPTSGIMYVTTVANGMQFVSYTGKTTVTTDSTASPQTLPPGAGLFNVTNAAGLAASGSVLVQTQLNGLQIVNYTSIIFNQLQGATGGTGTTTASGSVTQASFTGCTGGTGTANVGSNVGMAVAIIDSQFRANITCIDQSGATGIVGWYPEIHTLNQSWYGLNSLAIGKGAASSTPLAANEITLGNSAVTVVRSYGTYTFLSDARDKKDIRPIEAGMDFISQLKPVNFTWNMRDGGKVDQPDCGFIAQDIQQLQHDTNTEIPGLVYDANPDQLQIAPSKLLPVIIKALQEANDEIKELKRLIATLLPK